MLLSSVIINSLLCFIAVPASALPASRRARNNSQYKRLIVFGDSFSDDGGGAWIVSNMTWPEDPAYYNHSFSNGPVWPTTLATTLHATLLNYATGGATSDNTFIPGYTGPHSTILVPSAHSQLQNFLEASSPLASDVFVHWTGANDAFFDPNVTGASITSLITRDVDLLYRAGAKTILLGNYPPVDTFPATDGEPGWEFAEAYADSLDEGLRDIVAGYGAYMKVGVVDVRALFARIVADSEAYGIEEQYVDPPTACLQGSYASQGVPRSLCSDPERHLFFDVYHPVTQVHDMIAALFEDVLDRF